MNEDLLPADDKTYVSARNAKLARGVDLRKLLNQDQLCSLFQLDTIKWLSGEITQDRTPDLRSYLLNELRVEEVTPDSFARKITESFLTSQTDDWYVVFYGYLSVQEALWRSPRWSGDTGVGILRVKPIIRLEDDNLKVPFQSDSTTPNVFLPPPEETDLPIVKRSIASKEKVKDFLKRLGLSEPDLFDDIVRRVLPKYMRPDTSSISPNEHKAYIQTILRALRSDSESGKLKVIRAAKQTPFIKAVDQNGNIAFKKPFEIYFPTQEITDYFFGSTDVWFLNETESEEEWRVIGVENKPRFMKIQIALPGDEKYKLRGYQRHTRDTETTDYKLDGIENFLLRFSDEKKPFGKYSLILWNFLLEHLKGSYHYRFYEGEYKWYYRYERSAIFDANWKKQLRHNAWLPKNGDDVPHSPSELRIVDLPETFNRDDKLADLLSMKKDDVAILAEKAGIKAEDIDLVRQFPEDFQRWKAEIAARNDKTAFPSRISADSGHREKKMIEKYKNAPIKKYEKIPQSTKTTEKTIDAKTWLNEMYKNDAGDLFCQICKKKMPFKKRDGNYYFEAIEILIDFNREMEEMHIALCPVCAAKYKEYVKSDNEKMQDFKDALLNSSSLEIPVELDDKDQMESVRFVETHRQDIKTILESDLEQGGENCETHGL
ncbi:MAG: hypothetical protein WC602_05480 [archaeon]